MARLAAPAPPAAETDGRRRRTQESRARIVEAMLELVAAGQISPSAEDVAARAGVGLRSVFRHFKDMESLYAEMGAVIAAEVLAMVAEPLVASDWRERVVELVARRGAVYERVAPYRRAADVHRHESPTAQMSRVRLIETSREILRRELPANHPDDPLRFETLDMLLSFETWARLRHDQGLSVAETRALLEAAVRRALG